MKNGPFRKEVRFQRTGRDPDVIERKSGGGCLVVFGLPFFCLGLLAALASIGLLPFRGDGGMPSFMVSGFFGIIFMAVGGVLILGRSGLIIDRGRSEIVQWQGLIVPLRRTVHSLSQFGAIRLDSSREDRTTTYSVQLKGEGPAGIITVEQSTDYRQARRTAEELARFLNKPLEDLSSGRRVVRDPEHLDESLRERVRRLKEGAGFFPPQPIPMRTRIEQTAEGVILSIPGRSFGPRQLFPLVVVFVFAGIAAFVFLPGLLSLPAPPMIHLLFAGFIILFAILMPILTTLRSIAKSMGEATRITATRAFLRVEETAGGKTTTAEIPADELEELEFVDRRAALKQIELPGMRKLKDFGDTGTPRLPDGRPVPKIILALQRLTPSQGITACSDQTTIAFGKGLPEAELAYLHALILKTLTA